MSNYHKQKKIFNQGSDERFEDEKIIGGNPNGIINFNRSPYAWSYPLYKAMMARTWFPEQVNVSKDKVMYGQLTADEKRMYDLVLAQLITNDSIQTNQLMDRMNGYITESVVNAALARQTFEECIVEGTEVLTKTGWKPIEAIQVGDEILSANCYNEYYFTKVLHMTEREVNERLYRFYGLFFSQIVTEMHRMPYIKRKEETLALLNKGILNTRQNTISVKYAYEFVPNTRWSNAQTKCCHNMVNACDTYVNTSKDKWETLPDEIRLLIVLQADGTMTRTKRTYNEKTKKYEYIGATKTRYVTFQFSKERKIERFKTLLQKLNINYKTSIEERDDHITPRLKFMFNYPKDMPYAKVFSDVLDLSKFTQQSAKEFIDELVRWDGWDYDNLTVGYDTTVLENAEFVTAVAAIAGYRVHYNVKPDYRTEKNYKDLYRVKFNRISKESVRGTVDVVPYEYKGKVYCPTVAGGLFFIKHNNKVSLTGNSLHSQSYAVMAEDIANDTDRIYMMHHYDDELRLKNQAVQDMYDSVFDIVLSEDDTTVTYKKPTSEDLLMCFLANQILEEMVFPGGFAAMLSLEGKMPGTVEMIKEIMGDKECL
jgi:hypothetical protein